jgi:hypothetical protein
VGRDPSRHQVPASRGAPRCRSVALSGADKEKTAVGPRVVAPDSACHAGGRFESRRSRQNPCKSACCVVGSDARSWPTARTLLKRRRNSQKRPEMRSRDDFKPIQAEFELAATAACDYTRRPEVTGPRDPPSRAFDSAHRRRQMSPPPSRGGRRVAARRARTTRVSLGFRAMSCTFPLAARLVAGTASRPRRATAPSGSTETAAKPAAGEPDESPADPDHRKSPITRAFSVAGLLAGVSSAILRRG